MVCGCLVCGRSDVAINVQTSPAGKVVALIYLCPVHQPEAGLLSIVKGRPQ
jgi:hypothetical protein